MAQTILIAGSPELPAQANDVLKQDYFDVVQATDIADAQTKAIALRPSVIVADFAASSELGDCGAPSILLVGSGAVPKGFAGDCIMPGADIAELLFRCKSLARTTMLVAELRARSVAMHATGYPVGSASLLLVGNAVPNDLVAKLEVCGVVNKATSGQAAFIEASRVAVDLIVIPVPCDAGDPAMIARQMSSFTRTRRTPILFVAGDGYGAEAAALANSSGGDWCQSDDDDALVRVRVAHLVHRRRMQAALQGSAASAASATAIDERTGLFTEAAFLARMATCLDRTDRTETVMLVAALSGEKPLAQTDAEAAIAGLARTLRDELRALDMVARLDGDLIAIAMPDVARSDAEGIAGRMRRVMQASLDSLRGLPPIAVTVAAVAAEPGQGPALLIRTLRDALTGGKNKGREQVVLIAA